MKIVFSRCRVENDVSVPLEPDPQKEIVVEPGARVVVHYMHIIRKIENGQETWHCFPMMRREQKKLDRFLVRGGISAARTRLRRPKFRRAARYGVVP